MSANAPWWKNLFASPLMVEAQRKMSAMFPTQAEVDFLQNIFNPLPKARILDVPSGNGRHSLELARRGFQLTAVDQTMDLLADGKREAKSHNLDIAFEHRDMRDLPWHNTFDHAYCLGNSFAYFEEEGNQNFLKSVHESLKPGGTFVLETRMVAESLFVHRAQRQWYPLADDFYFLHDTRYDPSTSQLTSSYTILKNGEIDKQQAHYRIYTYRELMKSFEEVGFVDLQGYGSLSKEPFQLGAGVLYVVSKRAK